MILWWLIQGWVMLYSAHLSSYLNPILTATYDVVQVPLHKFTLKAKCIGLIGSAIELTPFIAILILFTRILKSYKINNIFSKENASSYKWIGYWCLLNGLIAKPVSQALITIAVTLYAPYHQVSVGITPLNLMSIFWGLAFLVVSHAMYVGYKMQNL